MAFFSMVHFYVDEMGRGEVVKYCKLKDCQKDDAQTRWQIYQEAGKGFDQILVRAVTHLTRGTR